MTMQTIGFSNVMDLMLRGHMAAADRAMGQAIERLATGKRINHPKDDVSGFRVAEDLRVDVIAREKGIQSAERHNHFLAAKEGALSVINDMAIELQGIVVQAANRGGLGEGELRALQTEADSILDGIDFISSTAMFKGEKLLEGVNSTTLGLRKLVAGDEGEDDDDVDDEPARPRHFLDLTDGDLKAIQEAVDQAASTLNKRRAGVGLMMQRNESNMRQMMVELEAMSSELSRIEDTDYAVEISKLVRAQILKETSMRSLMIGRSQAGGVLNLLSNN